MMDSLFRSGYRRLAVWLMVLAGLRLAAEPLPPPALPGSLTISADASGETHVAEHAYEPPKSYVILAEAVQRSRRAKSVLVAVPGASGSVTATFTLDRHYADNHPGVLVPVRGRTPASFFGGTLYRSIVVRTEWDGQGGTTFRVQAEREGAGGSDLLEGRGVGKLFGTGGPASVPIGSAYDQLDLTRVAGDVPWFYWWPPGHTFRYLRGIGSYWGQTQADGSVAVYHQEMQRPLAGTDLVEHHPIGGVVTEGTPGYGPTQATLTEPLTEAGAYAGLRDEAWGFSGDYQPVAEAGAHYAFSPDNASASKLRYKLQIQPGLARTVSWYETFTPDGGEPVETRLLSEEVGAEATETGVHEIDPFARYGSRPGRYRVLAQTTEDFAAVLAVDANRDGVIVPPVSPLTAYVIANADRTSATEPYRFWINDDDDGNALNNETEVEGSTNPDYASRGDFGIASKRDLEDFARLWISSAGIADALKSGALQIGLQWKADTVMGSPAINLYRHYEANGSTGYLTDNATAIQQTTPPYSTTLVDAGNKNVISATNGVFILKKGVFADLSSSQTTTHLLFEGAGVGKGMLQVLLLDQSGAQIGEGAGVWLDIRRINMMFERVKATTQYALSTDGIDATMPLPHDYIDPAQVPQPTMGWTADDRGEAFVPDPSEDLQNKNYIVFVHGWRQAPGQGLVGVSSSLTYACTMYKRLWHAGYKGRFVAFRWPTFYGGSEADDDDPLRGYTTYNDSEYRAWKAGESLAQYVNQLPSGYKRRITAHSMGNIVAGSAFKYGMVADSYAMLNAAVPALCYEETALRRWPTFTGIYGWLTSQAGYEIPSQSPNAPDSRTPVDDASPAIRALSYVRQLDAISARVVNFYLEADFATSISWNANNVIMRPHTVTLGRRYGYGWGDTDPGERLTLRDFPDQMIHRHPNDPHEVMAYDCKVPTFTVNATGGTLGSIAKPIDMSAYGFDREHSAQWQWRFQQTAQFYHELLVEFGLTPTL